MKYYLIVLEQCYKKIYRLKEQFFSETIHYQYDEPDEQFFQGQTLGEFIPDNQIKL